MYKSILLAADGSEHSKRAAENAIHIAKNSLNHKIDIVYIVDPNKAKSETLQNWNSGSNSDKRRQKIAEVERMVQEAGLTYEINILNGEPGATIVDYAHKKKVDIIILGSRGLNVLQEFVLGSVSHKVAKRANCPVLIVK